MTDVRSQGAGPGDAVDALDLAEVARRPVRCPRPNSWKQRSIHSVSTRKHAHCLS